MQSIKKGDLVQVVTGADRGKQGRVIAVDSDARHVRVDQVRLQKRHLKPGRRGARAGGIVEQEAFIDISNVMLVNPADDRPSRVRVEVQGGERVRVFTRGGQAVQES
jgi:large subunit ribosomal protein L24